MVFLEEGFTGGKEGWDVGFLEEEGGYEEDYGGEDEEYPEEPRPVRLWELVCLFRMSCREVFP